MQKEPFTPGAEIKLDQSLEAVMQRMCAVLRAEVVKLTLVADQLEEQFGCIEVMRTPESFFAVQASRQLRYALKDFPTCWCEDPATREMAEKELDRAFSG